MRQVSPGRTCTVPLRAGGAGAMGRRLVPQLAARGHEVTATTTSAAKLGVVEQLGAQGVVMDGLDAESGCVRGRSGRCTSPRGWPDCRPGTWR